MHINFACFFGVLPCLWSLLLCAVYGQDFNLTILHTNDVHARFEEINAFGGPCSSDCFGGVARRQTIIKEIRQSHENVLLLDAGDQFQGTIWYNYYQGNATKYFMQELGYDVMALGNHEFDDGTTGTVNFLRGFTVPVVSANLNSDAVPALQGQYSYSKVVNVGGRDIGVIGYVTQETKELVLPDGIKGLVFEDVIASVRREAESLTSRGVNIIIALGHAGFPVDIEVAKMVSQVDVVVGGHSNTFLYSGDAPSNEKPTGSYPYMVTRADGSTVPVVQAFTAGKYLGYLTLDFDDSGKLMDWNGNPKLLDSSIEKDQDMENKVMEWSVPLEQISKQIIGSSLVMMDGRRESCRMKECNMGNMVTDAMVQSVLGILPAEQGWAKVAIGLWNAGGIRASFDKGDISMRSVLNAFPFRNTIEIVEISGSAIWKMLENSVQSYDEEDPPGRFLQMSGIRVTYNLQMESGSRVASVEVVCSSCDVPEFSAIKLDEYYMVVTNNYMIQGGDGYSMIKDDMRQHLPLGNLLTDSALQYIKKSSPLTNGLQGRIQFLEDTRSNKTPKDVLPVCENQGNICHVNWFFLILSIIYSINKLN